MCAGTPRSWSDPAELAGRGTDASIAESVGARWLNEDPVAAAASTAAPPGADPKRIGNRSMGPRSGVVRVHDLIWS